ncbi:MAG: hypothetical protein V4634_05395 [Pseudomonadota bacterium]
MLFGDESQESVSMSACVAELPDGIDDGEEQRCELVMALPIEPDAERATKLLEDIC